MTGTSDNAAAAGGPIPGLAVLDLGDRWSVRAREYLDHGRELLRERHDAGASGHEIVAAWTAVMDHLLASLFTAARAEFRERSSLVDQRCALLAQGGYGRRELNPHSDVDLLFLYPTRPDAFVETITERILHVLWDTRLTVGNAARNVRKCVSLALRDLKVRTALLDTRFISGDSALFDEFVRAMDGEVLARNPNGFFRDKLEESRVRHARYGDSVYLVEPQLKEGEGGLRDLHTALWLSRVKFKTNDIRELVRKGVIIEREQFEIEQARDFLWRVRNAMHFMSGEHQDQLTFEYQERVAANLGFQDNSGFRDVEHFMRAYYLHAATIHRFSEEIIARCQERGRSYRALGRLVARQIRPGVRILGDEMIVGDPSTFQDQPSLLVRVFADAQRFGVTLSTTTLRLIRAHLHLIDTRMRSDPEILRALFDILAWKVGVFDTLREMHKHGVLGALLPEFERLRCMAQYDRYHIYTVDEHSLRAVAALERLRLGREKERAPGHTAVMRDVDRVEILYLAMLLHDIGKGFGGDHDDRGARMVGELADRLRLNADDRGDLEFLVHRHLLMSQLATRRDIRDPRIVLDFARIVGTPERLKLLYLVTFADMSAVNSRVWNNWHEMLLSDLYRSTQAAFDRGLMEEPDFSEHARRIKARVAEAIGVQGGASLDGFLLDLPDRYFLSTPEGDIPRHFELARRFEEEPLVMRVTHFPEREFSEFTVVTRDRPGLFARLTGVLTAGRLRILGARITTSHSGTAIDVFRVAHQDRPEVVRSDERWERVQTRVAEVLAGDLEVDALVARALRPTTLRPKFVPRVPTEVKIDNEASRDFTVIDVYTHDRRGILFAVSNSLYRMGLSVHLARITTNIDQVLDVFYVSDEKGRKIADAERMAAVGRSLEEALAAIDDDGREVAGAAA